MLNKIRKFLAFALVLCCLFTSAIAENSDTVVATYNGGEITINEVATALASETNMLVYSMNYINQMAGKGSYSVTEADLRSIREYVVEAYAKYEIIFNKMLELGLSDLTEEEKAALRQNAELYYLQYIYAYAQQGISVDEAAHYLDMQGMSIDSVYESYYRNAIQVRVTNALAINEEISEEEILAKYESLTSEYEEAYGSAPLSIESDANAGNIVYFMPENMRYIKHIILKTDDETLASEYDAAVNQLSTYEAEYAALTSASYEPRYDAIVEKALKEECLENIAMTEKLIDELQVKVLDSVMPEAQKIFDALNNGESFDSLIEAYSEDPGSLQEPIKSKGYLVYMDSEIWDEGFINAAASLENVGDISEPSVGYLGVYIVKYESETISGKAELESVRDAVVDSILFERKTEAFKTQSAIWYEEANIQLNIDAFN